MGEVVDLAKYSRLKRAVSAYRSTRGRLARDVLLIPFGPDERDVIVRAAATFSQFAVRSQLVWFATIAELSTLSMSLCADLSATFGSTRT